MAYPLQTIALTSIVFIFIFGSMQVLPPCDATTSPCNSTSETCLGAGASCNDTDKCLSNMTCVGLGNKVCNCSSDQYLKNESCYTYLAPNASCIDTDKCQSNMACVGSRCGCSSGQYLTDDTCYKSVGPKSPCNDTFQCQSNLTCVGSNGNKVCECSSGQYLLSGTCYLNSGLGGPCNDTVICQSNMTCVGSMCGCSNDQYPLSGTCHPNVGPNAACNDPVKCQSNMTCVDSNGGKICNCQSGEYLIGNTCYHKKSHGDVCDGDKECTAPFLCKSYTSPSKHCLCTESSYYIGSADCQLFSKLQVLNINLASRNTSYFTLSWSSDAGVTNVTFSIQTDDGKTGSGSVSGGTVYGLSAGTKYTGRVVSTLQQTFYPLHSENVTFAPVWTTNMYAGNCNNSTSDCIAGTKCLTPVSSVDTLCLCEDGTYATDNSVCAPLDYLKVIITNTTIGTHSINYTWSTYNVQKANASYEIVVINLNKNVNASATGGSVTGLVPGTKYTIKIVTNLPKDNYYASKSASLDAPEIWTNPAKPGNITHIKATSTSSGQYSCNISFNVSEGNVSIYTCVIMLNNTVKETLTSSNANFEFKNLTAETHYTYKISAQNGINVVSEIHEGSFFTPPASSDKPSNLSIPVESITPYSVNVTWRKPQNSNGNIVGYILTVYYSTNVKVADYKANCADCQQNNISTPTCLPSQVCLQNYTSAELNNPEVTISFLVSYLDPYTDYIIVVTPYNGAGDGITVEQQFRTLVAAASNLTQVTVNPFGDAEKVGLNITWTPGKFTGPTTYSVQLEEAISLTNNNFKPNETVEVSGYDNKFYTFPNLLAYWDYRVIVTANTSVGPSLPTIQIKKTLSKAPGLATFSLISDPKVAINITINITCPAEKERNGIITGYTIRKIPLKVSTQEVETEMLQNLTISNSCDTATSSLLTDLTAERNYSVQVMTITRNYQGNYTKSQSLIVAAKLPILAKPPDKELIQIPKSTLTTLEVKVCRSCVTDDKQGKLVDLLLLICPEKSNCYPSGSSRRKRSINSDKNSTTWFMSKKSGFILGYRATPSGWLDQLSNAPKEDIDFIIGNDASCTSKENVFCNGPLPSGTKFIVIVIVCTSAGCSEAPSGSLATQVEADHTGEIVGGVIGGLAILAILIAVIVVAYIYLRRRPRPSSHHPLWDIDTKKIKEHRPIRIREFRDEVRKLHKDSNLLFQGEFEDIKNLSARFPHTSDEAKREGNRVKNRYVDILPYDHTRVKLDIQPEDDDTMDFINANYIPGYTSVREYIATQGPMHCTIPDFWRMTWEQKCPVIVMLSDLQEQGKRKVDLYWPENLNEPINYGNIIVEMTNFSQLNKYIIRNFTISKGPDSRKVTHFFLPGWWDFSANLTTGDVLEFAKLVRQMTTPAQTGPIIVHCSAGVGRTGTFIALDYFMQFIEKHSLDESIDVFSYVMRMRNNRPRMVQAETQYIFIFDALDEIIAKKIKEEEERESEGTYQNMKVNQENVYANTKTAYDNEAFEPEYQNMSFSGQQNGSYTPSQNGSHQPTTSL